MGRVAEWLKATDCKSAEGFLRRFESCLSHILRIRTIEPKHFFCAYPFMQLNRVELSQTHIECFGTRALSEPYEMVAHHTALQFNLFLDLLSSLGLGLFL